MTIIRSILPVQAYPSYSVLSLSVIAMAFAGFRQLLPCHKPLG
jgi:hypothetical protein